MTRLSCQIFCRVLTLSAAALLLPPSLLAQFTNPSQDELKMTTQPGVPAASAVYLNRDLTIDDGKQLYGAYVRIKVLTDAGKKYAEVELPAVPAGKTFTVNELQARTIHADGSIVPFTGQLVDKSTPAGTVKAFTLPDVQPGSIVEYRYLLAMPMQSPSSKWVLQSELYTRKMHYIWKLSGQEINRLAHPRTVVAQEGAPDAGSASGGRGGRGGGGGGGGGGGAPLAEGEIQSLAWTSYLPKTAEVKQSFLPSGMSGVTNAGMRTVEMTASDIPPAPVEDNAPPVESELYRVLFFYSGYPEASDFWRVTGGEWSKKEDAFMAPSTPLTEAVQSMMLPADTTEAKLKKIYAAMMTLQNTDYAPAGTAAPAAGTAMQVWSNKSGTANQIAELFVAMARAAGFKAYVMAVPNGEKGGFMPSYLSLDQVPDKIAIVNLNGKEQFFDPGARYCTFGHLAWQHAAVQGIRQMDGDATSITQNTPPESYPSSVTQRVADLTLGTDGTVSGPVSLYFTGAPALEWRHRALRMGEAAVQSDFTAMLAKMLPPGTDIQFVTIDNLTSGEQKLTVRYLIKGGLGSRTGGKVTVPADPFEATAAPAFSADKRELPVDFHFPYQVQDVMRLRFPAGYSVDSAPASEKEEYAKSAGYSFVVDTTPGSVTVRRFATMADSIIPAAEYSHLKDYTIKLEQKSKQNVVLKSGSAGN